VNGSTAYLLVLSNIPAVREKRDAALGAIVENSNSKIADACLGKQYCTNVLQEEMDVWLFYSTVKTVSVALVVLRYVTAELVSRQSSFFKEVHEISDMWWTKILNESVVIANIKCVGTLIEQCRYGMHILIKGKKDN
jgi:hypothetical protein